MAKCDDIGACGDKGSREKLMSGVVSCALDRASLALRARPDVLPVDYERQPECGAQPCTKLLIRIGRRPETVIEVCERNQLQTSPALQLLQQMDERHGIGTPGYRCHRPRLWCGKPVSGNGLANSIEGLHGNLGGRCVEVRTSHDT